MTDQTLVTIEAAHATAQARFSEMIAARSYADPNHPATIAYITAERTVDDLLANAQWAERTRALEKRPQHDPECDCNALNREALSAGDHFFFPMGPGR